MVLLVTQPVVALLTVSENMLVFKLTSHHPVNPASLLCKVGVDTRDIFLPTANTPSHYANLDVIIERENCR